MKVRIVSLAIIVLMLAGLLAVPLQKAEAFTIPTFSIVSVDEDVSVTIKTANFPANQTFTVRMGVIGTKGIGGTVVGTTDSGAGGSFEATYDIPLSLQGARLIAIRMDSPQGFFSFNWFVNNTTAVTPTPSPFKGIPTFSIVSVDEDSSVTIKTNNFPANKDFTVRMGKFGTAAIGGEVVATTPSGTGGSFTATYDIPDSLKGLSRIAIRMDASGGFFAFNWFWNNTSTVTPAPTPFVGIPTFSISAVVKDSTVTIKTNNFPANKDFTVRMGKIGTKAIGGVVVATTNSGSGGTFTATYNIPDSLKGLSQIAIRMDASGGFFAFNWFWNSTTN